MTNATNTTALDAALDAAAPTQELWLKGKAAFLKSIELDSDDIKGAYYAALDAAAPDERSWIAGRDVLVLNGVPLLPGTKSIALRGLKMVRKIRTPRGNVIFAIIFGTLIGIVLAFGVGQLVTNVLPVLNPILWLIQLLLVAGGAAFAYRAATKPKNSTKSDH